MDNFKNFAKATVSTGYDASATSIVLSSGGGAKLPTPPFNATWWNSTDYPDPSDDPNREIVRVAAIASETLTITRAQESTSASTKNASGKTYQVVASITAKTFNTDLMSVVNQAVNGRLTLQTGTPVSITDQTAKTTIYFTPYQGNRISLYESAVWAVHPFSELSLALGTLTADKNYDVFVYNNAGTMTLELSAAWTSDTVRANALVLQDGVYVKSGATTRRYVGTIRTTATTTTEDSLVKRFVWNYYNRAARDMFVTETSSHSYNGNPRQWNNSVANQLAFVTGFAEDGLGATVSANHTPEGAGGYALIEMALDNTTTNYRGARAYTSIGSPTDRIDSISISIEPVMGYHFIAALENTIAMGAATFLTYKLSGIMRG